MVRIAVEGSALVAQGDTYQHRDVLKRAGFIWDPASRAWRTRRVETVRGLPEEWLTPEARRLLERVQARVEASRAASADAQLPVPPGRALRLFQAAGVRYILATWREGRGCLLADEMGLGKTVQAIVACNAVEPASVLIVCPATLKTNWAREWARWSTLNRRVAVVPDGKAWPDSDVVVINYDLLGAHEDRVLGREWDVLILDESHYIKNDKARRTRLCLKIRARRRLYLTGTPILNRPIELWTSLSSLDPQYWRNFWSYAKRYCGAKQVWAGRRVGTVWDFSGASNVEELQQILRSRVMVRRLKKDVLEELPPKVRQIVELNGGAGRREVAAEQDALAWWRAWYEEQRAALDLAAAADDTEAWRAQVARLREGARVFFEELSALRHDTALAKVPLVVEHVRDLLWGGAEKVVVFAHHHDVIEALALELVDHRPVVVTGETPQAERQQAVDAFQRDPTVRVFLGSIRAAGVGITLTAASVVVFAELDWTPAWVTQAEDRCHRIGQRDSVLVQHLVLEGSVDAHVSRVLVQKQELLEKALDRAPEAQEPVLPVESDAEPVRREDLDREAAELTPDRIARIHAAVRALAAADPDRARDRNDVGFNRYDSAIGHALAALPALTPRQAALALRLLRKYHRQVGEV